MKTMKRIAMIALAVCVAMTMLFANGESEKGAAGGQCRLVKTLEEPSG